MNNPTKLLSPGNINTFGEHFSTLKNRLRCCSNLPLFFISRPTGLCVQNGAAAVSFITTAGAQNVVGNSQRAKPLAVCAFRSLFYERYQAENE